MSAKANHDAIIPAYEPFRHTLQDPNGHSSLWRCNPTFRATCLCRLVKRSGFSCARIHAWHRLRDNKCRSKIALWPQMARAIVSRRTLACRHTVLIHRALWLTCNDYEEILLWSSPSKRDVRVPTILLANEMLANFDQIEQAWSLVAAPKQCKGSSKHWNWL